MAARANYTRSTKLTQGLPRASHLIGLNLGGTPQTDVPTFTVMALLLVAAGGVRWRHARGPAG